MDDDSLSRMLRDQLPELAAPTMPPPNARARVREAVARRRRRVRATLGTGLAGALAVGLLVPLTILGGPGEQRSDQVAEGPTGQWNEIAESPLSPRNGSVSVWTGEEMLVVGGNVGPPCPPNADCAGPSQAELRADGAAYDPDTDTWRSIAPAPVPFTHATATWTGEAMIVVASDDTLAYDPNTDAWRQLDPTPDEFYTAGVWTGQELVFWASEERANTADWSLDPATGAWTKLPPDPFNGFSYDRAGVWTGDRFVVFGVSIRGMFDRTFHVAEYDPETLTWSRLPDSPVHHGDPMWFLHQGKVVNPFEDPRLDFGGPTNGVYDPETKTWSEAPHAGRYTYSGCLLGPLGSAGDWLAPGGGVLYSLDPADTVVAPHCPQLAEPAAAVWTGDEVILWGGPGPRFLANTNAGLTWSPPPAGS